MLFEGRCEPAPVPNSNYDVSPDVPSRFSSKLNKTQTIAASRRQKRESYGGLAINKLDEMVVKRFPHRLNFSLSPESCV